MESSFKFAEVVFGIPLDRVFLYRIPEGMESLCRRGVRVFAPFGRRNIIGYIVGFRDRADRETKEIIEILDTEPVINEEMLGFTRWVADYYFCSWGEVIESAMPAWVDVKIVNKREIRRVKEGVKGQGSWVMGKEEESFNCLPLAPCPLSLSPYQENALKKICERIEKKQHRVFLLHGVTGSGKTEVYIRSAAEVLKTGRKVIVMVPEIALTFQMFRRFVKFFSGRIAVLHSGLTDRERYNEWMKIKNREVDIAIGARSDVFAPFENIGLIVVDEEHDTAYKQDNNPRYNGRDIAVVRGKLSDAMVILGSATPSLESFYNCQIGKYEYLSLPERIDKRSLPFIEVVDIKGKGVSIVSERLKDEIGKRIEKKEQSLLFLNRRGTARYIQCADCGFVWKCRNCSVSLTYHKKRNLGICHYCWYSIAVSNVCPECKGYIIDFKGRGTQRLEDEVRSLFPNSKIERMDRDTVKKRGEAKRILKGVEDGDIDVLIGTQMITKGHDYHRITLVGIMSADDSLNIPDFRASERTFQLITQVAGRAGRGDIRGDVILQTYNPRHYAIQCAKEHDFNGFYAKEGKFREALGYPPYSKMVSFKIEGRDEKNTEVFSHKLGEVIDKIIAGNNPLNPPLLRGNEGVVEKLGPSKAIIYKIKNRYRWHIILKGKNVGSLKRVISRAVEEVNSFSMLKGGIKMDIDVDPVHLI